MCVPPWATAPALTRAAQHCHPHLFVTSSKRGWGIEELRAGIAQCLLTAAKTALRVDDAQPGAQEEEDEEDVVGTRTTPVQTGFVGGHIGDWSSRDPY